MWYPGHVRQWHRPRMNAEYIYSSLYPSCPHFPTRYAPFYASTCKDWVVSLEFLKWATGFGKNVGITGKEPGYSFTRAVRGRFDMKRSSMLLFTAVESQLSERYAGSQLSHTVRRENHSVVSVTTDSFICLFFIQIGGGHSSLSNNVID